VERFRGVRAIEAVVRRQRVPDVAIDAGPIPALSLFNPGPPLKTSIWTAPHSPPAGAGLPPQPLCSGGHRSALLAKTEGSCNYSMVVQNNHCVQNQNVAHTSPEHGDRSALLGFGHDSEPLHTFICKDVTI
jgi:hypothetical protein